MRLPFLTAPGSWVRSARVSQTQAEYATPIEHYRHGSPRIADVLMATVIGILAAAALVHWWAS